MAWVFGGAAVLAIVLVLGAVILIGTPYFAAKAGSFITNKSGRNVVLGGKIEAHIWQREPHFIINQVKIGNAEWAESPTFFEAERVEFSIRAAELLHLRVVLPQVTIDQPKMALEKNDKGEGNWSFSQNPQTAVGKAVTPNSRGSIPIIGKLSINDGQLTYKDPAHGIDTTLKVATIKGDSDNEDIDVEGKGTFQKDKFEIKFSGGNALELRETKTPYPFHLKTTAGKTIANVDGTVEDPVTLEALDVKLDLEGDTLSDLYALTGIALPPTPHYKINGHLTRNGDSWAVDDINGRMGSSDIKGKVAWHPTEKPPLFEGDLLSENLDMRDLAGFVGAHKKPANQDRVIPDAPLDISRMMAMNADVTFKGTHIKTPDILDNFLMKVNLKDGVLILDPLSFGISKGKVESHLKIEGKQTPPSADLDVHFERLSLEGLFKGLADKFGKGNVSSGRFGGKATLHGHGKSLHEILSNSNGTADFGMEGGVLSQLLIQLAGLDIYRTAGLIVKGDKPTPINCIIADFSVDDGMMQAQEFLIDTGVSAIQGTGQLDLKDESVDLELKSYPKKPSLLSLRSPISLGGTLKHITFGVDPASLVVRGGAAALLAAAAPPAALLAFVGPGLGEDSSCAAFLKQQPSEAKTKNAHAPADIGKQPAKQAN